MSKTKKHISATLVVAIVVAVAMLLIDRLTKYAATAFFAAEAYGKSVPVINGVVSLCYRTNSGAGFSILEGKLLFLIIFTALAMAFIVYIFCTGKTAHPLTDWGYCLVLSGGIGNLIDRIFYGEVVDFICLDFINFPVFNVADICVTVGTALVLLYFIIDLVRENNAKKEKL